MSNIFDICKVCFTFGKSNFTIMQTHLLPPVFRKIAFAVLGLAAVALFLELSGLILAYYKAINNIPANAASFILPGDYVHFNNQFVQVIPMLLIIGVLLLAASRQAFEDEWIAQKRLVSYKIAFFSTPALTIIFLILRVDAVALVLSNLILAGLIQVITFFFLVKIQPRFIK